MKQPIDLSVQISRSDDREVARVAVGGELDMSNAVALHSELRRLEGGQPRVLVLDIAELSFMDVSGLRAILDAARRARREGRRLVVANPVPNIMRLFELTAIDQSLDVVSEPLAPVG